MDMMGCGWLIELGIVIPLQQATYILCLREENYCKQYYKLNGSFISTSLFTPEG